MNIYCPICTTKPKCRDRASNKMQPNALKYSLHSRKSLWKGNLSTLRELFNKIMSGVEIGGGIKRER